MIYKFTIVFLSALGIGYCAVPDLLPPSDYYHIRSHNTPLAHTISWWHRQQNGCKINGKYISTKYQGYMHYEPYYCKFMFDCLNSKWLMKWREIVIGVPVGRRRKHRPHETNKCPMATNTSSCHSSSPCSVCISLVLSVYIASWYIIFFAYTKSILVYYYDVTSKLTNYINEWRFAFTYFFAYTKSTLVYYYDVTSKLTNYINEWRFAFTYFVAYTKSTLVYYYDVTSKLTNYINEWRFAFTYTCMHRLVYY